MNTKKVKTSVLAVLTAAAIALSGTFAWQSISQMALNEAKNGNPGGRLHDDFSGYNTADITDKTKDLYVENFASQPIYARVRLDEYMEIGAGAGLKTGDDGYDDKAATSLVTGADINTPTTWTTHIPGAADPAATDNATADPFHDYWTWTMGGKTAYMPTFNKNQDSLKADVNGTLEGTTPGDSIYYDDYHEYAVDEEKTADAYYDCDSNATDEDPTKPGNGGTEGTNFKTVKDEKHTAVETIDGQVITMAAYKALTSGEKEALKAWVYDVDGWAYWSQAIQPGTATGLLLDSITLTTVPNNEWYYAINAVGQFITADDLGRDNNTGFYDPANGAKAPTADALALLKFIGVKTDASLVLTNASGADLNGLTIELEQGATMTLTAAVATRAAGDWKWTTSDASIVALTGNTTDATVTATAANDAAAVGKTATVTVEKGDDPNQTASVTIKVVATGTTVTYTADVVDINGDSVKGSIVELGQGANATYTASALGSNGSSLTDGTWAWTSDDTNNKITVTDGTVTVAADATVGNTAIITATCTKNSVEVATAAFTVKVTDDPVYALALATAGDTSIVKTDSTLVFTPSLTKGGSPFSNGVTYTWTATDGSNKAIKGVTISNGTLTVDSGVASGTTITVTAKATVGGKKVATAAKTVITTEMAVSVTAAGSATTIKTGGTLQYTAAVTKDGSAVGSPSITWSVKDSSGNDVDGASITNGLLSVNAKVPNDTVLTVKAEATVDSVKAEGTATVTVTAASYAVTVSAAGGATEIAQGSSLTFTAVATKDGTDITPAPTFIWTASAGTVNDGILSGVRDVAADTTITVTAKATIDGKEVAGTASVTVKAAVGSIAVSPKTANLKPGDTETFTATVKDMSGAVMSGETVTWSVVAATGTKADDTTIDSSTGVLTIAADQSAAILTVTGRVEGIGVSASVTVVDPVKSVTVTANPTSVEQGGTVTLTPTVTYSSNTTSKNATLTIEGSGHASDTKLSGNTLTIGAAEPIGTLTVKATSTEDNSKSNTVNITVTAKTWKVGEEATIDGDVYIVAAIDGNNALMLRKYVINNKIQELSTDWVGSKVYNYLNKDWLNSHSSIKNNAVSKSHPTYNGTKTVDSTEKVFVLSAADVGLGGSDYTYGRTKLSIFTDDNTRKGYFDSSAVNANAWVLRTTNENGDSFSKLFNVNSEGKKGESGTATYQFPRPAFWYPIDLL